MPDRTEDYVKSIKTLKEEKSISELRELINEFENATEGEAYCDEICDFLHEYNHYMNLSFAEMIDSLNEALSTQIENCGSEQRVAAEFLECEPDELTLMSYDHYGMNIYEYGKKEVAVGTDEEAQAAASEAIKSSLWAFNADFIGWHTKNGLSTEAEKALKEMQGKLCESANDIVEALIDDLDKFIEDAISSDGRGQFLSPYDSEEYEMKDYDGETFYLYRVN
jgi:hypothetical protein